MKSRVFGVVGIALLVSVSPAVGQTVIRPEVIIVLDTSGSMNTAPTVSAIESNLSGSDCGGDRAGTVDLCGDGICTGTETVSSCAADCNLTTNDDIRPGMATACANVATNPNSRLASRQFYVKRVLRSVLAPLRDKISVGLVTFQQNGYFQYFKGGDGPRRKVTTYFPKIELELLGGWNQAGNAPAASFVRQGTTYTLLSGAGLTRNEDSLYRDATNIGNERRFVYASAGPTTSSGGVTWNYIGSYYVHEEAPLGKLVGTWLGQDGCTSGKRCPEGAGDCDSNNQCQTGLTCKSNVGSLYWAPGSINPGTGQNIADIDVCQAPITATIFADYSGPQFVDSSNQTWVYRRFLPGGWSSTTQGISFVNAGKVVVPLAGTDDAPANDAQLLRIMSRLDEARNGGIMANGNTPTGDAIQTAQQHFTDRENGTGVFASRGKDQWASCRARFVLLLTDGESNSQTIVPWTAAANLYNAFSANPIRTLVIALPGISSGGLTELKKVADSGDDGKDQTPDSFAPYQAQDEQQLVKAIQDAIAVGSSGGDTLNTCTKTCGPTNPCPPGYICYQNLYCLFAGPDGGTGVKDAGVGKDSSAGQDSGVLDAAPSLDSSSAADAPYLTDLPSSGDSRVDLSNTDGQTTADQSSSDGASDLARTEQGTSDGPSAGADGKGASEGGSGDHGAAARDRGAEGGQAGLEPGVGGGASGCDCQTGGDPSSSMGGAGLLLALLALRRRRGQTRSAR